MWKYLNKGISTLLAIGIVLILAIVVVIFTWWQLGKTPPQPPNPSKLSYSLEDPELLRDIRDNLKEDYLGKEINLSKVFIEKEEGCPMGGFCLNCQEGKNWAVIYNKAGGGDACISFNDTDCYFGSISGKVSKTNYRPALPEAKTETVYYLDDVVISKCFEEKPAVSISYNAPEEIFYKGDFDLKISVKNNWKVSLNGLEFAFFGESYGFSIKNSPKECIMNPKKERASNDWTCKIKTNLNPGQKKEYTFNLTATGWAPPGEKSFFYLPDFLLQNPLPYNYSTSQIFINNPEEIEIKEKNGEWYEVYRNKEYGIEIEYPQGYDIHPSREVPSSYLIGKGWGFRAKPDSKGELIASFVVCDFSDIPSKEPYHSFVEELRIGRSLDPEEVKKCFDFGGITQKKVNINGYDFREFKFEDSATGSRTKGEIYRTIYNNSCYSVEKLEYGYLYDELERSDSPHYDPGYAERFSNCRKVAAQMLSSFRFLR